MTEQSSQKDIEMQQQITQQLAKSDFYDILGVARDANETTIKNAYRKLALKFHPDKNKNQNAKEVFKKVSNAYSTLTDQEQRDLYDQYGPEKYKKHQQGGRAEYHHHAYNNQDQMFEDIFKQFFGGNPGFTFTTSASFGGPRQQPQQQQQGGFSPMMKMFFFSMLMMWIPRLLGGYFQAKPLYSLSHTAEYTELRQSEEMGTSYYVGSEFDQEVKGDFFKLGEIEKKIDRSYLNILQKDCDGSKEQQKKWRSQALTASDPDIKKQYNEKASQINMGRCETLQNLQEEYINYISQLPQ